MTGAIIAISIVLIVTGGIAAIVVSCFRLQRHRDGAVAIAACRKLAGQAGASQKQAGAQVARLAAGVRAQRLPAR